MLYSLTIDLKSSLTNSSLEFWSNEPEKEKQNKNVYKVLICEVPRLEFNTNLCGNCCWDWPIDNQPKSPKWWPIMFFSATVNSNNWLVCLVQGEFIFTKHKTFLKSLDIHQQVAPNSGWCREKMLIGSFERNSFKLIGGSVWPSPEIRKFWRFCLPRYV